MSNLREQILDELRDYYVGSGEYEISDDDDFVDSFIALVQAECVAAVEENKSTDNKRLWKEKYDYRRGYLQAIYDSTAAIKELED